MSSGTAGLLTGQCCGWAKRSAFAGGPCVTTHVSPCCHNLTFPSLWQSPQPFPFQRQILFLPPPPLWFIYSPAWPPFRLDVLHLTGRPQKLGLVKTKHLHISIKQKNRKWFDPNSNTCRLLSYEMQKLCPVLYWTFYSLFYCRLREIYILALL